MKRSVMVESGGASSGWRKRCDHDHVPVLADGTPITGRLICGRGLALGGVRLAWGSTAQQCAAECQFLLARPVREEAEVPDAHERAGQDVQEEAPRELGRGETHHAFGRALSVVFVPEADVVARDRDEACVGDGDPVGVAGEVLQHLLG